MATHIRMSVDDVRIVWESDPFSRSINTLSCKAVAEVSYPIGTRRDRRIEWLSSGGLHEVELSGPDDPYKQEVELEQLSDLRDHLDAFGIETRDFASRFAPALER